MCKCLTYIHFVYIYTSPSYEVNDYVHVYKDGFHAKDVYILSKDEWMEAAAAQ